MDLPLATLDKDKANSGPSVLVVCHYHLATLVLADVLDVLDVVPEPLHHPHLSRLRACQAIVNTLSLSMSHDHYTDNESPYGSELLLDPAPELMGEVLLRAGNAILLMHSRAQIPSSTAQIMLSIIFGALRILSEVSRKALLVLSILCNVCSARKLKIVDDPRPREKLRAPMADLAVLTACNTEFIRCFLQEMQDQVTSDSTHFTETIKHHEQALMLKAASPDKCPPD